MKAFLAMILNFVCPVAERGKSGPHGLSRYLKNGGWQDWPFGSLCIRIPLIPYFSQRHYDVNDDDFKRGWMLGVVLLQVGRAPIWGVISFQLRLVVASTQIGRQELVHLRDEFKA